MKYLTVIISSYLLLLSTSLLLAQHAIIPQPVEYKTNSGNFILDNSTLFYVDEKDNSLKQHTDNLIDFIEYQGIKPMSVKQQKSNSSETSAVCIQLTEQHDKEIGDEGYTLNIEGNKLALIANTAHGVWNAMQTLKQMILVSLVTAKDKSSLVIPACSIKDYPMYGWRGIMLDVSRHFFDKEQIKQYLDLMSLYKFNVFHWHLTDDQGWRIEIKSLPKLTQVGAWRPERFGFFGVRDAPQKDEPKTYGGFYTHEDVKEIIQYAQERHITIVPEIDIPGHSSAAIAAYPNLSITQKPILVSPGHKFAEWHGNGKFSMSVDNTLDPTNEYVYQFVKKVMTEIAMLFPGEYIHMGGDECYHGFWNRSEKGKAFMKKKGLKDGHELQSYFVSRVNKIITSLGKKMIGWDEILEGGELNKSTAVMSWRGVQGGIVASQKKHKVVMSPTTHAYLDYMQGDKSVEPKVYATLTLKQAYQFNPTPEKADANYILGGQANLWTEQIPTLQHAFYMTYPRAFAIIESLWNKQDKKDWKNFFERTEKHFTVFDYLQKNICRATYDPIVKVYNKSGKPYIQLSSDVPDDISIYYTIDNTFPQPLSSPKAEKEGILLPKGELTLRVVSYLNGKQIGRMLSISRKNLVDRISKTQN